MVTSIQCYVDGKGTLHRTPADAHRADLSAWFQATGAVNEAGAAALANGLVDDRETLFQLVSMLEMLARDVPAAPEAMPANGAIMLAEAAQKRAAKSRSLQS
jgi:hypothetical protein